MDKLHLIETFVAVVDNGGFAGAARKLNISPPAVTRAINELEAQLGVRLLTRTTRFVRVTEAGERYAIDCKRILGELHQADEDVSGLAGSPQGSISITAPLWFGWKFVAPIVSDYLQKYPQVHASCWFMDRVVNLIEEGIDVALRFAELPDSSMQAIPVGRMRVVTAVSPSYLKLRGKPSSPQDLRDHEVIVTGIQPGAEWRYKDTASSSLRLAPRLICTNNEAAVSASAAGFGITQQMYYKVADHLKDGSLVTVLDDFEPAALPVNLLHREGRHASAKVRAFLDIAVERLRALPELRW